MSSNGYASTAARNRRSSEQGPPSPDHDHHWNGNSCVPRSLYRSPEEDRGLCAPWRLFEERVRTGPYGLARFPSQPQSPVRILLISGPAQNSVNPRLRRFIQDSPPRIRGEWHLNPYAEQEDPGLTDEEFKKAMKKVRKQAYNPPHPPRRRPTSKPQRSRLFSGRSSSTTAAAEAKDEAGKEEGKQCIICLEEFVPNEQVLVTPCNHVFHNDCLVPWVRSHGQCPVCRFALVERKENVVSAARNSNLSNNMGDDEVFAADLGALLRAMEEALSWLTLSMVGSHPLEIEE